MANWDDWVAQLVERRTPDSMTQGPDPVGNTRKTWGLYPSQKYHADSLPVCPTPVCIRTHNSDRTRQFSKWYDSLSRQHWLMETGQTVAPTSQKIKIRTHTIFNSRYPAASLACGLDSIIPFQSVQCHFPLQRLTPALLVPALLHHLLPFYDLAILNVHPKQNIESFYNLK